MFRCGITAVLPLTCVVLAASAGAGEPVAPGPVAGPAAAPAPAKVEGPAEFTDDLIVLKSGLALEGKVIRKTRDTVFVQVEYGVLRVPRAQVESIEFNLKSRLAELAPDDYLGRYRLAVSTLEEGSSAEARKVLEELVGKEGIPPEINRHLAGIYETEGELQKALDHWRKYSLAKPGDEETRAKITELEKQLGVHQAPTGGPGVPGVPGPEPAPKPGVVEGLEADAGWSVLPWGNKATATVIEIEGNKVLSVDIPSGGQSDKAAIGRSVKLDLSQKQKLGFRAFSAEKGRVQVALAVITAVDYFESRPVFVRPDWNMDLAIDLQTDTFKCKKTDWQFRAAIEGLAEVKQIIFLVYFGTNKALLYFDSINAE